ncbi:MAG: ABC transporter permease, partial [Clostridia bacterium]|nr:ABC transporter permease [Clostridia bacterium]
MIKLFFMNLWGNIKRSPIVSIILLIQMILFSYSIFDVIYTQQKSELNNSAFQKVYSNYSIYDIGVNSYNLTKDHHDAYRGKKFVSVDNTGFEQFEELEEKIFEFENLKSALLLRTEITLHEELEGIECNEETRSQYSFYAPQVSDPPSYSLNAYTVDSDYIDIFGLSLDSGRLFTEEEFTVLDPTHVPVLLGYDYKDYFSIGDTFEGYLFSSDYEANKTVFEVIGFISKGQLFMPISGSLNTYDNHVILPYVYNSVEEWLTIYEENRDYFSTFGLWTRYTAGLGTCGMIPSKMFLVEKGNEEAFV